MAILLGLVAVVAALLVLTQTVQGQREARANAVASRLTAAVSTGLLMEDAATAEISRAQIWQWLKFGVKLANGRKVTRGFFDKCLKEEMARVKDEVGREAFAGGRFKDAVALFKAITTAGAFEPFLTIPAYRKLG